MANLNEYVLRYIFDYLETPLEWMQVSEVCQLWKRAAKKHWKKINFISYLNNDVKSRSEAQTATVISARDAERIVRCAAPFIKVLIGEAYFTGKEKFVMFGPFLYKVKGFKPDVVMKILAQKAITITEICFDQPPRAPLLKSLFDTNNISKVRFEECDSFYKNVPTDQIEELDVRFSGSKNIKPWIGHFPNLKKLDLTLDCKVSIDLQKMLSPILPYIFGLKSLHLHLKSSTSRTISADVLLDISKLSKLEQLSISSYAIKITSFDAFVKKLTNGCKELRAVKFVWLADLTEEEVHTLLTLPRLDSLEVKDVKSFGSIELPQRLKLTQLKIRTYFESFDPACFFTFLQTMPRLKSLELNFMYGRNHVSTSVHRLTYLISCAAVILALTKNKNFVLTQTNLNRRTTLRITNRVIPESETETFNFTINRVNIDTEFIEKMKTYVCTHLGRHWAVSVNVE